MPTQSNPIRFRSIVLRAVLFAALAAFYVAAASEHGQRINTSKARGDQTGYLWDAQNIYHNWHGRTPPVLIGDRNRMPLYSGLLALVWNTDASDDQFFLDAKAWNIRLSLALLALLAIVFAWHLPPLVSANLTLVAAFGIFIFKAGYAQSELLFYTLFFLAFLTLWHALQARGAVPRLGFAVLGGLLSALAYLTKASVLPLVGIFAAIAAGREAIAFFTNVGRGRGDAPALLLRGLVPPALMVAVFLAVLSPYLAANKLAFGRYFYNVNTTFYAWYDSWADASVGTNMHGDGTHWPDMPADQIPSAGRYWRTHTIGQIASRVGDGFRDMAVRSYNTYWYFKYVMLYVAAAAAVIATNRRGFAALVREHLPLFLYVVLFAAVYAFSTAFYAPISGTGTTRFLMAHLVPLFFTLSCFFAHPAIADRRWTLAGATISLQHFHLLVSLTLAFDIAFTIWPRMMSTYGGF